MIYYLFETLDSTNAWAKREAHRLDRNALTVVRALYQTEGRGQQGRPWISPPGCNLLLTFLFFADEGEDPLRVTHVLAMSVVTLVRRHHVTCTIKWPNDILCDGKKLGGILCEVTAQGAVLVGLGLNVNLDDVGAIDQPATSLRLESGQMWDLEQLFQELCEQFCNDLLLYQKSGFTPFLEREVVTHLTHKIAH